MERLSVKEQKDRLDPNTDGAAHKDGRGDKLPIISDEDLHALVYGNPPEDGPQVRDLVGPLGLSGPIGGGAPAQGVYPGANYLPVALWKTNGGWNNRIGACLHVNDSNGPSLANWIARPDVEMSCHFQVAKSGIVEQYLPVTITSWCQSDGNGYYVSIETEGYPGEPLTTQQVAAIAGIMAWLNLNFGIPLQLAEAPNRDHGFIWHGAGGAAWGGHTGCPGDDRKVQRQTILNQAAAIITPPAQKTLLEVLMDEYGGRAGYEAAMKRLIGQATELALIAHDTGAPNAVVNAAEAAAGLAGAKSFAAKYGNVQLVRFINGGPKNNETAIYMVMPTGHLLWVSQHAYGVLGQPAVSVADGASPLWLLDIFPGTVDLRGKATV